VTEDGLCNFCCYSTRGESCSRCDSEAAANQTTNRGCAVALPVCITGWSGRTVRVCGTHDASRSGCSIDWLAAGKSISIRTGGCQSGIRRFGIICLWSENFWSATGIGWSIFLLGAAGVHLHRIHVGQTFAPENAGAMLYFDIVTPIIVLALLGIRADGRSSGVI
jgi:hypothetical protein